MKLASVSTYVVQTPPPHSGGALWFFVKLETEDGLVAGARPHSGGFAYLRRQLRKISTASFRGVSKRP